MQNLWLVLEYLYQCCPVKIFIYEKILRFILLPSEGQDIAIEGALWRGLVCSRVANQSPPQSKTSEKACHSVSPPAREKSVQFLPDNSDNKT